MQDLLVQIILMAFRGVKLAYERSEFAQSECIQAWLESLIVQKDDPIIEVLTILRQAFETDLTAEEQACVAFAFCVLEFAVAFRLEELSGQVVPWHRAATDRWPWTPNREAA
jgi:hypothetical protein